MNASELVAALRQETQTVANTEGASNVRLVLYYNDGTSKNCKLNPNGSWVQKPTATNGMVKFVWIDSTMAHSETVGIKLARFLTLVLIVFMVFTFNWFIFVCFVLSLTLQIYIMFQ